ncbi:MAG: Hsp20/alpha crystallin family protein [Planctomycetes bacterium]|nr:Hsp20/alpha crystallin family protein [Planctomycetota bacterium]
MLPTKQLENWDPFREMESLSKRMNRLFDITGWNDEAGKELIERGDWCPSCDISETEKEYRIHAELPNVKKEDVHVTVENGILTIKGERREEKEEKDTKFHRRELSYGGFMRRFSLPEDCDEGKVDASFKNGMLNVAIAKAKAKTGKIKEIAING